MIPARVRKTRALRGIVDRGNGRLPQDVIAFAASQFDLWLQTKQDDKDFELLSKLSIDASSFVFQPMMNEIQQVSLAPPFHEDTAIMPQMQTWLADALT